MFNTSLYLMTVLIWGTTWIAIKLQLGEVEVQASIIYRFAIAGLVMFAILLLSRRLQPLNKNDHLFCVLQGCCLFCFNFYCFYSATGYISSGLASVVFSLATVMNAVNNRIWYGKKPTARVVAGSAVGLVGIALLFWPEISAEQFGQDALLGLGLAALGTWFFSMGNMISVRHQSKGLKPPSTNAWSMFYGVTVLSSLALFQGVEFSFSTDPVYLYSLLYLAIPGTVIAFTTYLMLVGRIGADKAAYSTVMFPAVALTISTWFEGYEWSSVAVAGFILVLAGNLMIFARLPARMALRPAES